MPVFDGILSLDSSLLLWISRLPHPSWLTHGMKAASTVSAGSTLWYFLALTLVVRGKPEASFRAVMALLATAVVVGAVLKPAIGRERPAVSLDANLAATAPDTASFPSGHAAGAAAGAYSLSRIWIAGAPLLWSMAAVVTVSRLYLGVHYPLDVLAGLLIGLGCAYLVTGGRDAPL